MTKVLLLQLTGKHISLWTDFAFPSFAVLGITLFFLLSWSWVFYTCCTFLEPSSMGMTMEGSMIMVRVLKSYS